MPRFQQHPASLLPAAPGVIDWGLVTDEMRRNKDFRVLLLMGYYDLATPFFAVENTMYQTGMIPERVTFAYYEAGHMMYVHEPSLTKLAADLRKFVARDR